MSHPGDCYCPGKGYKHLYTIGASHILATSIAIPSSAIAWNGMEKIYRQGVRPDIPYDMRYAMAKPVGVPYSGLDHANAEHNAEE